MNYYLTGASGFIGQAIVRYLDTDKVQRIPRGMSITPLRNYLSDADVIINLAAYGNHHDQKDFSQMVEVNINSLYRLLEATKNLNVKFYNISTSSIYLNINTMYSITKKCGEDLAATYGAINIHPYSVYGEGEAGDRFIPTVIRHLHSGETMTLDESAVHDWIYVDDFVRAMFEGYREVGTGKQSTNIEVVRELESISGRRLNYTSARIRDYDCDNWVAPMGVTAMSLAEGLKKVYDNYKQIKI